MITVSYIDGIYNYGVDYSEQGAEVFEISMEDFSSIKRGDAYIEDMEVIYKVKSESDIYNEGKQLLVGKINSLQEISLQKRLEYTTVYDMLPEGNQIREMKLNKLSYEGDQILIEFETLVQELLTEYGENALADII